MTIDRRRFLAGAAAASGAALPLSPALGQIAGADKAPDNHAYWAKIADHYDVVRDVVQLENGNWGMMAKPVLAEYQRRVAYVNRFNSYYSRRDMGTDIRAVYARLGQAPNVDPAELVLTRNATEALKGLIGQYNRLRPGDSLLYADLDYDSMQACMESLGRLRGVKVRRIALPEPASHQGLIDAYARAFDKDPKIRLVLLTHLSHRTGLVIPVREIVEMARARGIDAIVDAAHSWGQLDFTLPATNADFVGLNLHKWMGAPLGVGVMYVRKSRIDAIDRDIANDAAATGIHARVHTGTVDYAAQLSVPAALDFQEAIGGPAREARLRWLRDRWVGKVRPIAELEILTPEDKRLHSGMTSFRLRGRTSSADNQALAKQLLERYGIFTVHRDGLASGSCVRVTPALHNDATHMDRLADALIDLTSA
ncbi:aminotransferase class V-fold PLP-dependent enzyme [Stakelama pacifica]|uniref:Selenocysteine lyase/cysteine desulfurase n=1 Tax=Stakelama pacifica TaxID=517720 RepID=A0A4R6FTI4_9SPHN|nr:aminotransferase class V-fold PLP-dependent enzyme [Stakelama pacifica]TDN84510.1 selenocysteine lyase/cysteine desulfurase [Stakelama pacifica]GGO93598.1 isopenicillin-N epimerase [Stakelama pacifica]